MREDGALERAKIPDGPVSALTRMDDVFGKHTGLRSFATGLQRDLAAVTAGLTLPWSSGAVEGQVNRIKMIKRQMFGRAKFDLLRCRILTPG